MDKALQEYYENRFDMMATKGWKDLLEDVDKMITEYNSVDNVSTAEMLHFRQGQLDILRWVSSLKSLSEQVWEELNEENV